MSSTKQRLAFKDQILFKLCIVMLFTITFGTFFQKDALGFDTLQLAKQIAQSLSEVPGRKYGTLAFSRIQGNLEKTVVNDLIDYSENEIVQRRRFRVIDRSKLQLILREQRFNLTGLVSSDTYKELGKLLGVDLFVYGRYYGDTIVLKAIDVESSAIVWADIFQLNNLTRETENIKNLALKTTASIRADEERLKASKINQISFWSINSDFDPEKLIDYLSVAITKDGSFQVVDRENLKLILEEQKLSMEDFIDESKAKRMGELYGIDAFIYGRIVERRGSYIASLKLLNIYNGVIEWARTLRFSAETPEKKEVESKPIKQSDNRMMFIPAGVFIMGSNEGEAISQPAFKVPLKAFYIDRTEVSNEQYKVFVDKFRHRSPQSWPGGNIPPGKEKEPVVTVSWKDAARYCSSQGKRLPKEVEWEKAFRGSDGRKFPWKGDTFYADYARTLESGVLGPENVDSNTRDVSPFGVKHMAGNVREWVDSYLRPYPGSNFRSSKVGVEKVIRGGSWAKPASHAVGWHRDSSNPTYGWKDVGFRCARTGR